MARRWAKLLNGGNIPRALAKAVVMTKPYGVTHKGIMDCVGETLTGLIHNVLFSPKSSVRRRGLGWRRPTTTGASRSQLHKTAAQFHYHRATP